MEQEQFQKLILGDIIDVNLGTSKNVAKAILTGPKNKDISTIRRGFFLEYTQSSEGKPWAVVLSGRLFIKTPIERMTFISHDLEYQKLCNAIDNMTAVVTPIWKQRMLQIQGGIALAQQKLDAVNAQIEGFKG